MLRLSLVQFKKKTLRNKIALHENFMMVQPIAAGTQETEVRRKEKWHGVEWSGNTEKCNDTALTGGKAWNVMGKG